MESRNRNKILKTKFSSYHHINWYQVWEDGGVLKDCFEIRVVRYTTHKVPSQWILIRCQVLTDTLKIHFTVAYICVCSAYRSIYPRPTLQMTKDETEIWIARLLFDSKTSASCHPYFHVQNPLFNNRGHFDSQKMDYSSFCPLRLFSSWKSKNVLVFYCSYNRLPQN